MQDYSIKKISLLAIIALCTFSGCSDTTYVYEINDIEIRELSAEKTNLKSTSEFIRILYFDLIRRAPSAEEIEVLDAMLDAFGQSDIVKELLVQNLVQHEELDMISQDAMKADIAGFVEDSYKRFFGRAPSEQELIGMVEIIESDESITPVQVAYALLTSNEYKFY